MEFTGEPVNKAFFDLTDPASAYVFGFLQADGTHTAGSGRKGRVSVEIKADDVQLLSRNSASPPLALIDHLPYPYHQFLILDLQIRGSVHVHARRAHAIARARAPGWPQERDHRPTGRAIQPQ